jgi:hypothetical protein
MTEPVVSMAEAARLSGLSVSTLRRRRDALVGHGATRHDAGWVIPISALVALGLMPPVTPPDAPSADQVTPVMTPPGDGAVTALTAERDTALERASAAEHRAEIAERTAAERDRVIEAQAHALQMLEAAPTTGRGPGPSDGEATAEASAAPARAPRRSLLARLFSQR